MILGVGVDIVEIKRIKNIVEKWGDRFLNKIFTEKEISYCYKRKDPYPHLAARFAAKESFIKALPEDREQENSLFVTCYSLRDIEILNEPSGKPFVNINFKDKIFETSFKSKIVVHLTLSHERNYAIATVVLERKNP